MISAKIGMPLEEFLELGNQQPFELINGERRPKLPNMFGHGKTIRAMFLALHLHALSVGSGEAFNEMTFILPDSDDSNWVTGSRIPDVMFYVGDRVKKYEVEHTDADTRPLALVPDLVVEVVSPNDKVSELDEKIDAYLADGIRLIWVIDPQRRKAVVYAPDAEQPRHLAGDAVMDGEDVLPGFKIVLSSLFGDN
jgi:Uma2 family endonuclease